MPVCESCLKLRGFYKNAILRQMQDSEETRSIDQMDHIFDHDTYCHMHQTSHVKCIAFHATHLKRHTYSDTCVYVEMCVNWICLL